MKVIIYTTDTCPYCVYAKRLMDQKKISYEEIRVDVDPVVRDEMIALSGRRTVPQIIINDKPIGGFDDLQALEQSGRLDALLNDQ